MKNYSKIILSLLIIINEVLKFFVVPHEYCPYLNLVTCFLVFIFSFNSTSYVIRALFVILYCVSFILSVFLQPVPSFLVVLANLALFMSVVRKKDNNLFSLVISILNFAILYREYAELYWFTIIVLNLVILIMCGNNISVSHVISYNIISLLVPFIRWDYSFIVYALLLVALYVVYIQKRTEIYKYRLFLVSIGIALFFLRLNVYVALLIFVFISLVMVLLRENLQDIYSVLGDFINKTLYSWNENVFKFIGKLFRHVGELNSYKISSKQMVNRYQLLINRIDVNAVVAFAISILLVGFLYIFFDVIRGRF